MNFINDNMNVNLLNAVINEIYINAVINAVINTVINAVINDISYVLMYLRTQDCTWQINIGIHLHTQTHWTPLIDTIYAVIIGVNKARTMQSGVLLSAHLACALFAHFASQVCTVSILWLAPFPSAQVGCKTQHLRPTCAVSFLCLMVSINGIH